MKFAYAFGINIELNLRKNMDIKIRFATNGMFLNKNSRASKKRGRITTKRLILVVCASALFIFSYCSRPRSVSSTSSFLTGKKQTERYAVPINKEEKKMETVKKEPETKAIKKQKKTENGAKEEAIAGLSEENPKEQNNDSQGKVFSSLQSQLDDLNEGQDEIKDKIDDIEKRLKKLENSEKASSKRKVENSGRSSGGNILLPDEEVKAKSNKDKSKRVWQNTGDRNQSSNQSNSNKGKGVSDYKAVSDNSQMKLIKNAVREKDYQEAIKELKDMLKKANNPVTINICYFLLGESHLGLKQYGKAIEFYKKVIDSGAPDKSDEAQLMIAKTQVRRGRVEDAVREFENLIRDYPRSEYVPVARKMLQQL